MGEAFLLLIKSSFLSHLTIIPFIHGLARTLRSTVKTADIHTCYRAKRFRKQSALLGRKPRIFCISTDKSGCQTYYLFGSSVDLLDWMETYYGQVRTTADAIILFEACRIGLLPRVQRRFSERERQRVRSGSVFVWGEHEAGMKRWTDGKSWSPSRVSGSFLTYREMESKLDDSSVPQNSVSITGTYPKSTRGNDDDRGGADRDPGGFRYKPDGLTKQSFSITTSTGHRLHLIGYYSRSNPLATSMQQPTADPALRHILPQKGLYPESAVNDQQNISQVSSGPIARGTSSTSPSCVGDFFRTTNAPSNTPSCAWPPTSAVSDGPTYYMPVSAISGPPHGQTQCQTKTHQQYQLYTPHSPPPPPPQELPVPHCPATRAAKLILSSAVPHSAHPGDMPIYPTQSTFSIDELYHDQQSSKTSYNEMSSDPKLTSPRALASAHHSNGVPPGVNSPYLLEQAALPSAIGNSLKADDSVLSIGASTGGASLAPLSSTAATMGSPLSAQYGPASSKEPLDIPNEKLESDADDIRALRLLDRVFTV